MKVERIIIYATVHSTEDAEKVAEAIATLIPFEFEIIASNAEGHFGNPLVFLEVEIDKKKEIRDFWNFFIERIEDQKDLLLDELDLRIDEDGFLHIRVDKQEAYLGRVVLISHGDGIVVRVKITTYPLKRESVINAARELILKGY
jgi:hypothetical protein